MDEGNGVCKRCGAVEEHGMMAAGNYYCSRFCMLEDNPDLVERNEGAREWLAQQRKLESVKARMRALKKEAAEEGIPWS